MQTLCDIKASLVVYGPGVNEIARSRMEGDFYEYRGETETLRWWLERTRI